MEAEIGGGIDDLDRGASLTAADAYEIAMEGFLFAFPLVFMELTRRACTAVPAPQGDGRAPMNEVGLPSRLPDGSSRLCVRPQADALLASAWLDLAEGPVVVEPPALDGLPGAAVQVLSLWSDVFALFGPPGRRAGPFALVGPGFRGDLPAGLERVLAPTRLVWLRARAPLLDPRELAGARAALGGLRVTPLAAFRARAGRRAPSRPPAPDGQVAPRAGSALARMRHLSASAYFDVAARLMAHNPPQPGDAAVLDRLARIRLYPGERFDAGLLSREERLGLELAVEDGWADLEATPLADRLVAGWELDLGACPRPLGLPGFPGARHRQRAVLAYRGLFGDLPEDVLHPTASVDAHERTLSGAHVYRLHVRPDQIPPTDGPWSLTLYDGDGFLVDNPLGRHVLPEGALATNADGSFDLHVCADPPGGERTRNWLPAPRGEFLLQLRLYRPRAAARDGSWTPPPVERVM